LRYNAPKLLSAGSLDVGTCSCGCCEGVEKHPSHRQNKQVPTSRLPANHNLGCIIPQTAKHTLVLLKMGK